MNLDNKQVFITGCNRGMGHAFALALAARGCHLHLLVRDPDSLNAADFTRAGARSVTIYAVDLAERTSIEQFLQEQEERGIPVDLLLNNAGFFTAGLAEEQPIDDILRMLQVNLAGLIQLTHGLLPAMLARGEGKIVNNASISGRNFFPCSSTYAASKAGVVAFTESIAQELRGTGVTTLLLITAGVKTDMFDSMEGFFGDKMNLDLVSAVPAEVWAARVLEAIESDRQVLHPGGMENVILFVGRHFPGLLKRIIRGQFKRQASAAEDS